MDGVATFGLGPAAPVLQSVKAAFRDRVASEVRGDQQFGRRTSDKSVLGHDCIS
jgi:hypothetical protein